MEVLCINDSYTPDSLQVFAKHNIKYPKANEICEVTRVKKYPRAGKVGFFLKGYEGQFIFGKKYGLDVSSEVSFDSKRFAKLDGTPLSEEEISLIKKTKPVEV